MSAFRQSYEDICYDVAVSRARITLTRRQAHNAIFGEGFAHVVEFDGRRPR